MNPATVAAVYFAVGVFLAALSLYADSTSIRPWRTVGIEFAIVSIGWLPVVLFVLMISSMILVAKIVRPEVRWRDR